MKNVNMKNDRIKHILISSWKIYQHNYIIFTQIMIVFFAIFGLGMDFRSAFLKSTFLDFGTDFFAYICKILHIYSDKFFFCMYECIYNSLF